MAPELHYDKQQDQKERKKDVLWAFMTLCLALTAVFLEGMLLLVGLPEKTETVRLSDAGIMDKYDMYMTNQISDALSGIFAVDKAYWLSDDDLIAPKPDPSLFGEAADASGLQWLLDDAAGLLDGQKTIFTTETPVKPGSTVTYYLDETIFVVTWQQYVGTCVFTCSEVRIAHPSQFRRFLSGGEYGSRALYTTTDMAVSVNAVTASSGDYYSYRHYGIVVNNGIVHRSGDGTLDTCMIDDKGDLLFVRPDQLPDQASAEQYVKDHNIRFSLAFGPVIIENSSACVPDGYITGEITKNFSRAALCQLGELHYMLVSANREPFHALVPTVQEFAGYLLEMGVPKAYCLDGGQTATIVTGNKKINHVDYGEQRRISDIIYFATAIPEGA